MNRLAAAAALLLSASPAFAAASGSIYDQDGSSLEGIYAAVAGGGQLMITAGNNAFGYDVEARLGYSFNPALQVYLAGSLDSSTFTAAGSFKVEEILAVVQYHLFVRPAVMVYGRAGIGVGLSGDLVNGSTAAGLAEAGGLGIEFRVGNNFFIAPELFYRNATLSAQGFTDSVQVIGLQLALVYY